MRTLIAEDDPTSRTLLQELLKHHGPLHVVSTGADAVTAVTTALDAGNPFDLICLDIMMPVMDGRTALKGIRTAEESRGVDCGRGAKVLMVTALNDKINVTQSFRDQCDGYLVKPIDRTKLLSCLNELGLLTIRGVSGGALRN